MAIANLSNQIAFLKVGNTAFHLAVKSGRWDIVEALLMCGSDPNIRNKVCYIFIEILFYRNKNVLVQIL